MGSTATSDHNASHEHPEHLAHHFQSMSQQFEAAKLGMWIFLGTEILMFGGLFCAYAVYRGNHPEVFQYAHHALDKTLGAINTIVLIASSFTMAWGVRCAQLGKNRGLIVCLLLTLLGAFGFMGIKSIEYHHKWESHKWIGTANLYHPKYQPGQESESPQDTELIPAQPTRTGETGMGEFETATPAASDQPASGDKADEPLPLDTQATEAAGATGPESSLIAVPKTGPSGLSVHYLDETTAFGSHASAGHMSFEDLPPAEQKRVHLFFQIYFLMTGLHGLHVLVGMGLILWILMRAIKGHFGPVYFVPVDLVGLYWHLVDLIWIFLFPLLYLIH